MPDDRRVAQTDRDSIHRLPLSLIPLETSGLKRACLVKNARLDTRVELFYEAGIGSGQVAPGELYRVFDFDRQPHPDVDLIETLSKLPSYDVYSLRIHLRRLGLKVEDAEDLSLSAAEKARLSVYMRDFLRPLIASIYGVSGVDDLEPQDIVRLFESPDVNGAKQNLLELAEDLEIEVPEIPNFIQEYGDAYLSLSYYQYYFERVQPVLDEFYEALDKIADAPPTSGHQTPAMIRSRISHIEQKLRSAELDITSVMNMFRIRTANMWQAVTAEKFRSMRDLIREYQVLIGAALCTMSVKMQAWKSNFPKPDVGSVARRMDFVVAEIGPGIDTIRDIKYSDAG